ncbi:hypothetical protein B0H66DRAFT_285026 [Apodospora peruviana]|uniref:Uncharacterized protein n=1 Tax=Apodospora peruviana TaxID=516989 RepID=A0AAE0I0L5_9PEZI|nr:hypothetical protein B0H66DRAFT_285026 [Apodospora peruviana]
MFLHSGASLHGHEYSDRQSASSPQAAQNLRYPLLWSPFAPTKPRSSTLIQGAPAPVLRQRPASDYIPRTPEPVVRFREPAEEEDATSVMTEDLFSESEFSESTLSIDGVAAAMAGPRRRPRRAPRRHTTYFFGYPTPKLLGKKKVLQKVLPRLLLQLQKVSDDGRARPVLELFPSSRIAGPVITPRLAKRFPGIFGVKRQLGYDDLVLVRRDDEDSTSDTTESDDESFDKQRLVAVYSPLRNTDSAEIVLDDGSVWVARPLPNGSYDFVHEDEEGNMTTVRWARRSTAASSPRSQVLAETGTTAADASRGVPQSRFTFSIINPLSRRHPVLASLTHSSLDVQDTYTSASSFGGRYPRARPAVGRTLTGSSLQPTPVGSTSPGSLDSPATPATESTLGWATDGESENETVSPLVEPGSKRTIHTIDEATKMLISVTALWVALRSGWSPNYTPSISSESCSTALSSSGGRSRRNTWSRATTSDVGGRVTPQLSESETPQPTAVCPSKRNSMPAQSIATTHNDGGVPPPSRTPTPGSSNNVKVLPRRATSTGAAFMQKHLHLLGSEAASEPSQQSNASNNGGRKPANLTPPPSNHDNAHILSPIPATPATRPDVRSLLLEDDGITTPSTIPRSISVMAYHDQPRTQTEESGSAFGHGGHKKGGLRSRLSRWVHRLGVR